MTTDYELVRISDKPIVKIAASFNRLWIAFGNEVLVYEANNELKIIVSKPSFLWGKKLITFLIIPIFHFDKP